uniref:non-specific serine/threonine protein kinase n=2 Tax=Schistosoma mansoni TaxID=6183 RepID=A0A3Q0KN50_SCHMA
MTSSDNLPLNELEKELLDPNSECYLENLLDVVSALVSDCDFPSAKNSKSVQSFLKKYSQAAKIIESRRTKYTDFELIKVIGQGGFGRVELARHKRTRRVYAIKLMSKQHLLDHSQSGYWEERDVMVKASSEWLVACHYAFLDKDNVYLCMEYMPGGDLYYWLEKYDTFDETIARFYLAETVLALEALHELGFIHRDLKPDNMLLDAGGHLKLADFGSCVRVGEDGYYYCTSPIGTPDYISPEMLSCQAKAGKIGPACDWWALGVIAYEMFFGEPAFYGQSLVETYSRILGHEKSLRIPTDADPISPETELFIKDLLKSSTTRLGSFDLLTEIEIKSAKNNRAVAAAQQVKSHVFFKSIQWEQLRSENAPIQPIVNSETDTSNINFDERDLSSDGSGGGGAKLPHSGGAFAPARPQPPAYFTGSNLSFAGFTFNRYHRYLEMFSRGSNHNNTTTTDMKPNHQILLNESLERQKLTEQALNELKQSYQILECQTAKDQINLKDVNRRLIESQNELEQLKINKIESDQQLSSIYQQLSSLQLERDHLQSDLKEMEIRLQTINLNLDNEYHNNSILKTDKEQLELRIHQLEHDLIQKTNEIIQLKAISNDTTHKTTDISTTHINNSSTIQQDEIISNLKNENQNLLNENQQIHEKCKNLMNLITELRYNLNEQVNELKEQLITTQELNHFNINKYNETNDLLEKMKVSEESLRQTLLKTEEDLQKTMKSKESLEEQLVHKDIELAIHRVRLRNLDKNLTALRNNSSNEVLQLNNLLERNTNEINDLSKQLDEMRNHCTIIEQTNNTLTLRIEQLQKEKDIQQRNLDTLVEKFYSEMKSRTSLGPSSASATSSLLSSLSSSIKLKSNQNHNEYKQLEKKYKNLQSTSTKDIQNLHHTIEQYKKDLAERNQLITNLTEQYQLIYKELIQQKQLERNLRTKLNYYIDVQSTPMKHTTDNDTTDRNTTTTHKEDSNYITPMKQSNNMNTTNNTTTNKEDSTLSLPNPNPQIESISGMNTNLLNIVLEDIVDIDSKGRGKNKLIWLPKYVVLKKFTLLFYTSRSEYETNPLLAEEIPLYRIMHVREATELDLIHAKKEDLCRTIQLFYQNPTKVHHIYDSNIDDGDNIDLGDTSFTSSSSSSLLQQHQHQQQLHHHQSMLKSSSKSNQDITSVGNTTTTTHTTNSSSTTTTTPSNTTTIQWMNHNFQLMTYHLGNILCDICHKNCSDLLNPPKALECLHCHMRIHFEHVNKHEKCIPCHMATNVRYLRMSNIAIKKLWIEQFMYLRQYLKELKHTTEQSMIDMNGSLNCLDGYNHTTYNTTHNNSSNNIVYMNPIKSLYRSMRGSSLGPPSLPNTTTTTNTTNTTTATTMVTNLNNQKSDFQYSFRKKLMGSTMNITNNNNNNSSTSTTTNTTTSSSSCLFTPKYNKSPRSLSPTIVLRKTTSDQ